ncbi:hypothetical protein [Nitrosomonas mobilis]|uniref:Uncharacterized protein n=1 Tax=Nitrosomonas mobilis TaxID=51642 RepID=A0A1G5SCV5_9PROT|nr:hypothetical protein [Nitrosomonas mobilis]SCZ85034.1 exported hypothetical protein [Nitrosomonas mobilis]HNO75903.1 hypothetical protein [Nitrosomonas mobilis]
MKNHILTWALSVLSAVIIGAAWMHTHPVQKFVTIDLTGLFSESAVTFAQRKDESALIEAQAQAIRIDMALQQLANSCGCFVLNSASIAKRPDGANSGNIADMTSWVKSYLEQK